MFALKQCRNCSTKYSSRSGRGLCRMCWDNKEIRAKYPLEARFGGAKAGWLGGIVKQARAASEEEWQGRTQHED